MKLLILGGTVFLGRHLVDSALTRGHEVTLFNRGQHNPDLYPDVEKLRGDRDGDLGALEGRRWDNVIDTCGYVPRIVRQSAKKLANAVDHYTFISTISVYADSKALRIDEDSPLATLEDESVEEITGETYGGLKVLCEQAVEAALPGRTLIIRPGLIVGPHDPSDRFTYWPHRVAQGEDVLAPDRPEYRVQFIDARDLADWNIRLAESKQTGVYNATGPESPLPMGDLLESCKRVSGSDARFVWADTQFLIDQGVGQWMDLPLWIDERESPGFHNTDCSRAIDAGLIFRPVDDITRDTLDWDATRPAGLERRAGITREREAEVLEAWKARSR